MTTTTLELTGRTGATCGPWFFTVQTPDNLEPLDLETADAVFLRICRRGTGVGLVDVTTENGLTITSSSTATATLDAARSAALEQGKFDAEIHVVPSAGVLHIERWPLLLTRPPATPGGIDVPGLDPGVTLATSADIAQGDTNTLTAAKEYANSLVAGLTPAVKPKRFVAGTTSSSDVVEFNPDPDGEDEADSFIGRWSALRCAVASITVDATVSGEANERTWEVLDGAVLRCLSAGSWSISCSLSMSVPSPGSAMYLTLTKNGQGIGERNGIDFDPPGQAYIQQLSLFPACNPTTYFEGDFEVGDTVQLIGSCQNSNSYSALVTSMQLRAVPA